MKIYFQIEYSVSFIVAMLFWGLYLVDPKLLFKEKATGFSALNPLNLILHGGNFLFNLIEHSFLHPGSINQEINLFTYLIISGIYFGFIYSLYKFNGFLVYGFLSDNFLTIIIVVIAGACLVMLGDLIFRLTRSKTLDNNRIKTN